MLRTAQEALELHGARRMRKGAPVRDHVDPAPRSDAGPSNQEVSRHAANIAQRAISEFIGDHPRALVFNYGDIPEVILTALRTNGYEVDIAQNSGRCGGLIADTDYDLILTLNVHFGMHLYRNHMQRKPPLGHRVVFLTEAHRIPELEGMGCRCVAKPSDAGGLVRVVDEICREFRASREVGVREATCGRWPMRSDWLLLREDLDPGFEEPKCHASTITETREGLAVAYFGGADYALVQDIWLLRSIGQGWEPARRVAVTPGRPVACWNPVLHQIPGGPLQLFYKVGLGPITWKGMLLQSRDAGHTWTLPIGLPAGTYGPVRSHAVTLSDGSLLCGASTEDDDWHVHFERTPDRGASWTRTPNVAAPNDIAALQPTILLWPDGRLQALCRSRGSGIVETQSTDGGTTWTPLRKTGLPNPNSGIEALVLKDGRGILIYNPTSPPEGFYGGPRNPLSMAVSRDGSAWERVGDIDDSAEELSYPAAVQASDGRVHVTYTAGDGWSGLRHAVIDPAAIPALKGR